jgi:hypothetical protein
MSHSFVSLLRCTFAALFAISVAASCGGGAGGSGGSGAVTPGVTGAAVSLSLVKAGTTSSVATILAGESATARAVVTGSDGSPLAGVIVKFAAADTALLSVTPASVLTDSAGLATATVTSGSQSVSGATALTATATISGKDYAKSLNVSVSGSTTTQQPLVLTLSQPTVTVGGSVKVTATVKTSTAQPAAGVIVTFQSSDPAKATLNPAVGTAVTDAAGLASITVEGLTAGQVNITATADVSGTRQAASVELGVGGLESRIISFVGASSSTMTIAGTGGTATSELTFDVKNQNGAPIQGVVVTFAPSVTTGGLKVSPLQGVTDAVGKVVTVVTAGTVPTPVRVTATVTLNGATTSTQSSQLSVSSGLPTQNFFSLSVGTFNIDGCDFDGTKTPINARLGDQFGNPVPDGTTVNFITEGGRIGASSIGSCQTKNGVCSVDLESQNFRSFDCRVSISAYAVGQESFIDTNQNGIYDSGEPFTDLADVFLKVQPGFLKNGYVPSAPVFTSASFDVNAEVTAQNTFDPTANPLDTREADRLIRFTNTGQTVPASDGVWGQAHVRGSAEVVFSARNGTAVLTGTAPSLAGCTQAAASSTTLRVRLVDRNGNPFAAGSTITAEGTGVSVKSVIPAAVPVSTQYGGTVHGISLESSTERCAGGTAAGVAGSVRVTVTPVNGVAFVTSYSVGY